VTAVSSNQDLIPEDPSAPGAPDPLRVIYTSPNSTGSLRFTPKTDAYGETMITVRVNDGQPSNSTFEREFKVTVNDPPTLAAIDSVTIDEDAGLTLPLSGIAASTLAGENQTLTVTARSSNQALIPDDRSPGRPGPPLGELHESGDSGDADHHAAAARVRLGEDHGHGG
jgi:hypothetical protein